MNFFLPKRSVFFDDLNALNTDLQKIVKLFNEFLNHFGEAETYAKRAKEIEADADDKTHGIITRLNKTFITPIDREDIYLLSGQLDDIVDLVENVIKNVLIFGVTEKFTGLDEFGPLMQQAAEEMGKMIVCLENQKYTETLTEVKRKIHDLEDKADENFAKSIKTLFSTQTDPIKIIKHKEILEELEHVMDKYQFVCDTIEGIVVKAS